MISLVYHPVCLRQPPLLKQGGERGDAASGRPQPFLVLSDGTAQQLRLHCQAIQMSVQVTMWFLACADLLAMHAAGCMYWHKADVFQAALPVDIQFAVACDAAAFAKRGGHGRRNG